MNPSSCPFCGSADVLAVQGYADITYISCGGCGALVSFRPALKGDKAIRKYNTRAHKESRNG